jgi:hypothetical protein
MFQQMLAAALHRGPGSLEGQIHRPGISFQPEQLCGLDVHGVAKDATDEIMAAMPVP